MEKVFAFSEEYKNFLTNCKTEREVTDFTVKEIEAAGYRNIDVLIENGTALRAGDKVYANNMGKGIAMMGRMSRLK